MRRPCGQQLCAEVPCAHDDSTSHVQIATRAFKSNAG